MLYAVVIPDWVGISTLISALATAIVFVYREFRRTSSAGKKENLELDQEGRRNEQRLEQEGETYNIRQLRGIIRDIQAQRKQETAECESRIKLLQQEVKEIRESERLNFAETQRLAAVNKILEQQIQELKAALHREGINVISAEHTPLPDSEGEHDARS